MLDVLLFWALIGAAVLALVAMTIPDPEQVQLAILALLAVVAAAQAVILLSRETRR